MFNLSNFLIQNDISPVYSQFLPLPIFLPSVQMSSRIGRPTALLINLDLLTALKCNFRLLIDIQLSISKLSHIRQHFLAPSILRFLYFSHRDQQWLRVLRLFDLLTLCGLSPFVLIKGRCCQACCLIFLVGRWTILFNCALVDIVSFLDGLVSDLWRLSVVLSLRAIQTSLSTY